MGLRKISNLSKIGEFGFRTANTPLDGDIMQISIKDDDDVFYSAGITYSDLQTALQSSSTLTQLGHPLADSDADGDLQHTDVEVQGDLQYGQALVWNGEKFTNEFALGGTGVDWEYKEITGHSNIETPTTKNVTSGSGNFTYTIDGFLGTGISSDDIRSIYIQVNHVTTLDGSSKLYATYPIPVGSRKLISSSTGNQMNPDTESDVICIPINKDQETVILEWESTNISNMVFTIIGVKQVKTQSLGPDMEFVSIIGTVDKTTNIPSVTDSMNTKTGTTIWSSTIPDTTGNTNWSNVLPLSIDSNVTKTQIEWKQWDSSSSNMSGEFGSGTIIIDWTNNEIIGNYGISDNDDINNQGYIYTDDLNGIKTFGWNTSSDNVSGSMEVTNSTIESLPFVVHDDCKYENVSYSITNYKTVNIPQLENISDSLDVSLSDMSDNLETTMSDLSGSMTTRVDTISSDLTELSGVVTSSTTPYFNVIITAYAGGTWGDIITPSGMESKSMHYYKELSYGSIKFNFSTDTLINRTVMYEMNVDVVSYTTIDLHFSALNAGCYVYVDGILVKTLNSMTNYERESYNLTVGQHLIQYVIPQLTPPSNFNYDVSIFGDIISDTVKFVG